MVRRRSTFIEGKKSEFWSKHFVQKSVLLAKNQIWSKVRMLPKIKLWSKLNILIKNQFCWSKISFVGQKSVLLVKNQFCWSKISFVGQKSNLVNFFTKTKNVVQK